MQICRWRALLITPFLFAWLHAQQDASINPAPDRRAGEGDGPFERLVIRGVTMIDGTGAPPRGPIDIVIEGNRIREVRSVGAGCFNMPAP